jgi:gephyrin
LDWTFWERSSNAFAYQCSIHAKHDKKLLEKVTENDCEVKTTSSLATRSFATEKEDESTIASRTRSLASVVSNSSRGESEHTSTRRFEKSTTPQMSNVCCEDPDHVAQAERAVSAMSIAGTKSKKKLATKPSSKFNPPPPPEGPMSLNIGILTVSNRAASGEYQTGDLSGPAVEQALAEVIGKYNSNEAQKTLLSCNFTKKGIVPDDMGEIGKMLSLWSGKTNGTSVCDIIFTTGGTGFASRDVTPEATAKVIDKECKGLMAFVLGKYSAVQPLAALSRGTVGVTGKTFIVNLPGNPEAVGEILNILFPLLLHAVKDMKRI